MRTRKPVKASSVSGRNHNIKTLLNPVFKRHMGLDKRLNGAWLRRNLVGVLCCNDDTYSILVVLIAYNFSILRLPTLSSVSTDPPANRNGLLEPRARTATHNKTRRRPVVATRGKLKFYRENSYEKTLLGNLDFEELEPSKLSPLRRGYAHPAV
ncbi:hypothetical protein EVAR_25996_1 [Eumeta japonica]|uniref:Uncharacterized protein n=1 Tax=Eumeta variegata TaxID=151549 RepID=A0A4C1V338_EUMVA|nr:hypothetical protein EVAR_25996_1 [Eumeta japonica]